MPPARPRRRRRAGGKIGIFNLPAIHATPLAPEILKRTEEGNIITEEVRFTSVPGVRVFGYYSYPKGGKKLPATLLVRYVGAESRKSDAKNGFVGFSICAPNANTDPAKKESLGGAPFNQNFTDDPAQSWVYHHVVALTRALDYMASRPETDMKRVVVMGYSWAGYITALLHGIDNRPCAYVSWHGTGYYADVQGMSGDKPSLLGSRQYYEMYAPSAYAKYGTQPIYMAVALTDYFATLDGLISMYTSLRCPKLLSVAPNRYHANTSRDEFRGSGSWAFHWQGGGPPPPKVTWSFGVRRGSNTSGSVKWSGSRLAAG
ncbi:MAG: Acetyl esterase Axe7A precursor [bacterium ADurb.Bin429]|nr:MAG: Acetyl esterase Axe7A precursor [bacterium ADurb.Bin429]